MLCIRGGMLYTPFKQIHESCLLIDGEEITALGDAGAVQVPADCEVIEANGKLVVPGFIDLQLNGGFGLDFGRQPQTLWQVAAGVGRFGVTAFLPTLISSPLETLQTALDVWRQGPPEADYRGARPLGWHLEGPFLSLEKKGAHNPQYLRHPEPALVQDWTPQNGVRMVTLAPELPGGLDTIRTLRSNNVVISAGHSAASYEEGLAAIAAGARYGTHLFNAMSALNHRQPGLTAALLNKPDVVVGLIADGIHVHPGLVSLIWKLKQSGGLTLVSDAMAALGMPPGKYDLGDFEVVVREDGSARLPDGTLAGSILAPDEALRNLMKFTGCGLSEALPTLTTTPAAVLGLKDRGLLAVGAQADVVILSPQGDVQTTIAAGQVIFSKNGK